MAKLTGQSATVEVRLMKYQDWDDQVGELMDSRTDTWELP